MASTLKIDTVTTPDGTGNITFSRPIVSSGGISSLVKISSTSYATETTTTSTWTLDDTIPQNTEGAEMFTLSHTPASTSNNVLICVSGTLGSTAAGGHLMVALFKDSVANALYAQASKGDTDYARPFSFVYTENPNTTSAVTYKLRYGSNTGTTHTNRPSSGNYWGGVPAWHMQIIEYTP